MRTRLILNISIPHRLLRVDTTKKLQKKSRLIRTTDHRPAPEPSHGVK